MIFCVAPAEESLCEDEVQVTQEVHVEATYTMYAVSYVKLQAWLRNQHSYTFTPAKAVMLA